MISRLLAQSIRYHGLWQVMSELFMQHEGCGIQVRRVEGQAGQKFCQLGQRFSHAILLGVVHGEDSQPLLNPDPEIVLDPEDMLVFLASRYEDCVPGPRSDVEPQGVNAEHPLQSMGETHRVLILGWSRKVPALLRELARFGADSFEIDIVSGTPVAEREADLDRYLGSTTKLSVNHIEEGFAAPGVIEEREPDQYDDIVVLASEQLEDKEHADAVSVASALRLRGCLSDRGRKSAVMVELLDYENLNLFQGGAARTSS